jgi:hypothetical protein
MHALTPVEEKHATTVAHLSRASVKKHFDAYADIDWESPEFQIDPRDPRFEAFELEPIGATAWYRSQTPELRARIGLELLAYRMKMGIEFENILSRGLLEHASRCENGSPEFRYAYHELIEEGQHSLMFQEFVNRSGCDTPGLSSGWRLLSGTIPRLGGAFPELFFVYVLAGEVPIDQVQRQELKRGPALHPLVRRISQIHVTEEARHVCFAESFLEARLPRLGRVKLARLRLVAPFATAIVADLMLRPPTRLLTRIGVPRRVVAEAYSSEAYRTERSRVVAPLCRRFAELGVVTRGTRPIWQALQLWPLGDSGRGGGKALSSGAPLLAAE